MNALLILFISCTMYLKSSRISGTKKDLKKIYWCLCYWWCRFSIIFSTPLCIIHYVQILLHLMHDYNFVKYVFCVFCHNFFLLDEIMLYLVLKSHGTIIKDDCSSDVTRKYYSIFSFIIFLMLLTTRFWNGFQLAINPEFKVGEMSFDNNAAVCEFINTLTSVWLGNCYLTRP